MAGPDVLQHLNCPSKLETLSERSKFPCLSLISVHVFDHLACWVFFGTCFAHIFFWFSYLYITWNFGSADKVLNYRAVYMNTVDTLGCSWMQNMKPHSHCPVFRHLRPRWRLVTDLEDNWGSTVSLGRPSCNELSCSGSIWMFWNV